MESHKGLLHIYINDLTNNVEQIGFPILLADDASILESHSNLPDFNNKLNIAFKTLDDWFGKILLSLNISKTHCINFTTKTTKSTVFNISHKKIQISTTNQTKFLGLLTDYSLS
jgi:hypothetical protein